MGTTMEWDFRCEACGKTDDDARRRALVDTGRPSITLPAAEVRSPAYCKRCRRAANALVAATAEDIDAQLAATGEGSPAPSGAASAAGRGTPPAACDP